ncbi:SDR family NAD(P)-dependent oxidoreductase [Pleurocapsa sp. PCC 7319]|uniref:SDR family NAD(P)-dependent oxidoreductase n=1 Tax=Pleurocapsa sp. PCC 7319 TaxID=118161 RepID=UPI000364D63D|nr:SDR family NAD(P)-dependent oxidoreductase [Pleurocapsa sp. PCC 7319]
MQKHSHNERIALISGCGSGICAEIAQQLAEKGMRLILIDKNAEALDNICDLVSDNLAIAPICVDVSQVDRLEDMISEIPEELYPDILINGVGGDTKHISVEDLKTQDYHESFTNNFLYIPVLVRLTAKHMKLKGWGRIINFASIAGRTYTHFSNAAYVSSKAAVIGYTKQCAYELASSGITVNCVAHGPIMTDRIMKVWQNYDVRKQKEILEKIPVKRLGFVVEAASIVIYLAGEESGYTTGAIFDINGGLFM